MSLATANWTTGDPFDRIPNLRQLAELAAFALPDTADAETIQHLFQVWGTEAKFEENAPGVAGKLKLTESDVPDREILELMEGTGTFEPFGLRTVFGPTAYGLSGEIDVIMTGRATNWMVKIVEELDNKVKEGMNIRRIYAIASDRPCTLSTEVHHPLITGLTSAFGRTPNEREVLKYLLRRYSQVELHTLEGIDGKPQSLEAIFMKLLAETPSFGEVPVYAPTNGNATYVPLDLLRFILEMNPRFDRSQFVFSQAGVVLARTREQVQNRAEYQHPLTAFSGIVRLLNAFQYLTNS